jgi:hypothetical protein
MQALKYFRCSDWTVSWSTVLLFCPNLSFSTLSAALQLQRMSLRHLDRAHFSWRRIGYLLVTNIDGELWYLTAPA